MKKPVIKRQSLTEQIKTILIDRIISGVLLPGDRLKELQIADEFGTSQAPVREAIRSLQALGYVEHKAHVGALIKTHTSKEIAEAYQVREALEMYCLTVIDMDISQLIETLNVQLTNMKEAAATDDVAHFTRADNLFHRAIIASSCNVKMLETWDSLKIQLQIIATHVEAAMPLDELYALHPPIVAALINKMRKKSARHLTKHYRNTEKYWNMHN